MEFYNVAIARLKSHLLAFVVLWYCCVIQSITTLCYRIKISCKYTYQAAAVLSCVSEAGRQWWARTAEAEWEEEWERCRRARASREEEEGWSRRLWLSMRRLLPLTGLLGFYWVYFFPKKEIEDSLFALNSCCQKTHSSASSAHYYSQRAFVVSLHSSNWQLWHSMCHNWTSKPFCGPFLFCFSLRL